MVRETELERRRAEEYLERRHRRRVERSKGMPLAPVEAEQRREMKERLRRSEDAAKI